MLDGVVDLSNTKRVALESANDQLDAWVLDERRAIERMTSGDLGTALRHDEHLDGFVVGQTHQVHRCLNGVVVDDPLCTVASRWGNDRPRRFRDSRLLRCSVRILLGLLVGFV